MNKSNRSKTRTPNREDQVIIRNTITVSKVDDEGEEVLAAVPGSVLQAASLARVYAEKYPDSVLLIRRGEKVLSRMEPIQEVPAA